MSDGHHDRAGQRRRREQIGELLVRYTSGNFSSTGEWTGRTDPPGLRERLWYALAFLDRPGGPPALVALGNAIITGSEFEPCHFGQVAATLILCKCPGRLTQESTTALRSYIGETLGAPTPKLAHYVGVNDNFPAMSTCFALLGGEVLGLPRAASLGRDLLYEVVALLSRRGLLSEYTSPTYSPISLHCMAEIGNHTSDGEIRSLALAVETRIWLDILLHYHPPTCTMAGPHSRAYTVDCVGHATDVTFVLYALLGDAMRIRPTDTIFSGRGGDGQQVIHHNPPFMQAIGCFLMSADYHCPTWLVDAALGRPYPFEVRATTEVAAFGEPYPHPGLGCVYPGGAGNTVTWMTEDCAVGTTDREFATGVSTNSLHVLYRRRRPVAHQRDVGAVYTKYISNEKQPDRMNRYPADRDVEFSVLDEGRKFAIQSGNTAAVLYRPKLYCARDVGSLKLSVVLPSHYGAPDEVWLGGEPVFFQGEGNSVLAESVTPTDVVIRDGPVYLGLRPGSLTDHGRAVAVRVEMLNRYLLVSFYNYEGPRRGFTTEELYATCNGVAVEVRSEEEGDGVEGLRSLMLGADLDDRTDGPLRHFRYARREVSLECAYCPATEVVRHASVNGHPVPGPQFRATGIDSGKVPFLGGDTG